MSCKSLLILLIVPFVLLSCFVEKGVSIKCFACRSISDPKCADPFDNSTIQITDCSQEKECSKVREKVNGQWQYIRGCASIGEHGIEVGERCIMRTDDNGSVKETCTCDSKDGCNSAPGLHHNIFLRYGGLIATLIITWFLRP